MNTFKNTYKKKYIKSKQFLTLFFLISIISFVCTVVLHKKNLIIISILSYVVFFNFFIRMVKYEKLLKNYKKKIKKYRHIIHFKLILEAIEKNKFNDVIKMLNTYNFISTNQTMVIFGILYHIEKNKKSNIYSDIVDAIDKSLLVPYS